MESRPPRLGSQRRNSEWSQKKRENNSLARMKPDITIIVSSCDAYADCWEPFFKLFELFWPDCPYPLVLITETKSYEGLGGKVRSFPALTVSGKRKLEWGGRLMECLRRLDCQAVFYLQEDFFLKDRVDQKLVAEFGDFMARRSSGHEFTMQIGLCPLSNHGPFHVTEHPLLWEVDKQAKYRFSLLPGLWNRVDFLACLRPGYSAWEFEESSHYRARRNPKRILTINRQVFRFDGAQVYPFDPSGVLRGKWVRSHVVELFAKSGIEIDFSRRGFADEASLHAPTPLAFGTRVRNALHWHGMRLINRINEGIDRFRS